MCPEKLISGWKPNKKINLPFQGAGGYTQISNTMRCLWA